MAEFGCIHHPDYTLPLIHIHLKVLIQVGKTTDAGLLFSFAGAVSET